MARISSDDRSTIINGLRVAAERFAADARDSADHPRLAEQFSRQAADSLRLAERIEEADQVAIISD